MLGLFNRNAVTEIPELDDDVHLRDYLIEASDDIFDILKTVSYGVNWDEHDEHGIVRTLNAGWNTENWVLNHNLWNLVWYARAEFEYTYSPAEAFYADSGHRERMIDEVVVAIRMAESANGTLDGRIPEPDGHDEQPEPFAQSEPGELDYPILRDAARHHRGTGLEEQAYLTAAAAEILILLQYGPGQLGWATGDVSWGREFFYLLTVAHLGHRPPEDVDQVAMRGVDTWYTTDILLKALYDTAHTQYSARTSGPREVFEAYAEELVAAVMSALGPTGDGIIPGAVEGDPPALLLALQETAATLGADRAVELGVVLRLLHDRSSAPTDGQWMLLARAMSAVPAVNDLVGESYD